MPEAAGSTLQTCPTCGVEVPVDARRCPDCGRLLAKGIRAIAILVVAVLLAVALLIALWAVFADIPAVVDLGD
jgi:predicted nucleic acid-binding Zn ribbon protein